MARPTNFTAAGKVASYLSQLNPIPRFPEYTGPYKVGTVDVEIPVSELESPAPAPADASEIETIQFRIFYPAQPDSEGKRITWLPAPQRDHLSAYIKFLGVGTFWAQAASFLPRHLHYTSIPVIKNAPLLEPETPNKRWPTAIFSHGLGGNRNAYSQIAGSVASHGVVVVCPEHRDGSAVVSFVRMPSEQKQDQYSFFRRQDARLVIPYRRIPHEVTDEIHELRNEQLRVRLWELGLVHEAVLALDDDDDDGSGPRFTNLNASTPPQALAQFARKLHVRDPGSIVFMGHSFGAATTVQFLKSVYYADHPDVTSMGQDRLYAPASCSKVRKQVTPRTVAVLLDMWCFPLLAKTTKPLFDLPLPAYGASATGAADADDDNAPPPPGGGALLAVASEDFFKWKEHLHATARALSPDPRAATVSARAFESGPSESGSGSRRRPVLERPRFFYVRKAAHLNQSDFGVLFPLLTRRVFGSEEPERALRLNLRAVLQVLRENGVPVARTCAADLVDGGCGVGGDKLAAAADSDSEGADSDGERVGGVGLDGTDDDKAIFGFGGVDAWERVDIVGMGQVVDEDGKEKKGDEVAEKQEPEMAGAIEPGAAAGGETVAGETPRVASATAA
ncbi:hypothetical protein DL766_008288 [Monosporascus sp. MC13-8B]|uniref:Putative phospholipase n=1 Tax=Monosporascus cannonballus TaxID=155416 RepID=A0ABY0H7T8_9PEZI|nr:hypothetical protein DL762_005932 [Monosporascus cannonballus]RYO91137.1 hypothetical protein DL763_005085 [Monosporascus cannonballus]RYP20100.1 hypothetical protein DL766_008288 [Monosporascus sp. MC13-8B]